MMDSAFDSIPLQEMEGVYRYIADELFANWHDSNLDETTFYADWQIARLSNNEKIQKVFNEYYELEPTDTEYFNV